MVSELLCTIVYGCGDIISSVLELSVVMVKLTPVSQGSEQFDRSGQLTRQLTGQGQPPAEGARRHLWSGEQRAGRVNVAATKHSKSVVRDNDFTCTRQRCKLSSLSSTTEPTLCPSGPLVPIIISSSYPASIKSTLCAVRAAQCVA
jgi:hypothetical protein